MKICILGATGLVGRESLDLVARAWPKASVALYASRDQELDHRGVRHPVRSAERLEDADAARGDLALVALDDAHSKRYVPRLLDLGYRVVDKSNTYRADPVVPLAVAGVNDGAPSPTPCASSRTPTARRPRPRARVAAEALRAGVGDGEHLPGRQRRGHRLARPVSRRLEARGTRSAIDWARCSSPTATPATPCRTTAAPTRRGSPPRSASSPSRAARSSRCRTPDLGAVLPRGRRRGSLRERVGHAERARVARRRGRGARLRGSRSRGTSRGRAATGSARCLPCATATAR